MNKKAFTLIELLATIVVLAIISLIAIPIVLNMIENSKIKATEQSLNGIIRSLKQQYARMLLTENIELPVYISYGDVNFQYEIGELNNSVDISHKVKVSGNVPTSGIIVLKDKTTVEFGYTNIKMNGYTCTINDNKVSCGKETNQYTKGSCFEFSVNTAYYGSNVITGYKSYCPKDVVIPLSIELDGSIYKVKSIGPGAFSSKELTSVDFSQATDLINIFFSAFSNNKLTSVDLSNNINLTTIGNNAFNKNELTSIKLPSSLTSIGASVFNRNKLPDSEAYIYARNTDGSINNKTLISYGGANKDVVIPSNVEVIYSEVFYNSELTSIDFSRATKLKEIQYNAFGNNLLTNINLSGNQTLETIGSKAFDKNKLTNVDLSNCKSLKTIASSAFAGTNGENFNKITALDLSNNMSLETIGSSAFSYNSLQTINLDNCTSLKKIGDYAFSDNRTVINLDLSQLSSLETIGGGAFRKNYIISIIFPDSLISIGPNAFYDSGLKELDLSNCSNLTTIGSRAFYKGSSAYSGISNFYLTKIKSNGKTFDWGLIINGRSGYNFITGTVINSDGDVIITSP